MLPFAVSLKLIAEPEVTNDTLDVLPSRWTASQHGVNSSSILSRKQRMLSKPRRKQVKTTFSKEHNPSPRPAYALNVYSTYTIITHEHEVSSVEMWLTHFDIKCASTPIRGNPIATLLRLGETHFRHLYLTLFDFVASFNFGGGF